MRHGRFTEDQIIAVFAEQEAGLKTKELCRTHWITDATFYKWKARFGGMTVPETAQLRSQEEENRRLKKLLAKSVLDNAVLSPAEKKAETACGTVCCGEAGGR